MDKAPRRYKSESGETQGCSRFGRVFGTVATATLGLVSCAFFFGKNAIQPDLGYHPIVTDTMVLGYNTLAAVSPPVAAMYAGAASLYAVKKAVLPKCNDQLSDTYALRGYNGDRDLKSRLTGTLTLGALFAGGLTAGLSGTADALTEGPSVDVMEAAFEVIDNHTVADLPPPEETTLVVQSDGTTLMDTSEVDPGLVNSLIQEGVGSLPFGVSLDITESGDLQEHGLQFSVPNLVGVGDKEVIIGPGRGLQEGGELVIGGDAYEVASITSTNLDFATRFVAIGELNRDELNPEGQGVWGVLVDSGNTNQIQQIIDEGGYAAAAVGYEDFIEYNKDFWSKASIPTIILAIMLSSFVMTGVSVYAKSRELEQSGAWLNQLRVELGEDGFRKLTRNTELRAMLNEALPNIAALTIGSLAFESIVNSGVPGLEAEVSNNISIGVVAALIGQLVGSAAFLRRLKGLDPALITRGVVNV